MALDPFSLAFDATSQGMKSLYGLFQLLHSSKGLKNLQFPTTSVDPNILQNKMLAGQYASEGIPDSARNFAADAIDRNLGSSIGAGLASGQSVGFINNAAQGSNEAFQNLMMQDALQKSRNRETLLDANKQLADENLRVFNWNKVVPYEQKFNQFTNQTNAGAQNIFGGLQGFGADLAAGNQKQSDTSTQDLFRQFLQYMSTKGLNNAAQTGYNNAQNENFTYP